jgi:hypothetical protein
MITASHKGPTNCREILVGIPKLVPITDRPSLEIGKLKQEFKEAIMINHLTNDREPPTRPCSSIVPYLRKFVWPRGYFKIRAIITKTKF